MLVNRFGTITRTYRHIQRYREIASVLLKHEFGGLVATLGLHRYLPRRRWRLGAAPAARAATRHERLRLSMEELGPTFVKLGQMLSTRRDILPPPLITELEKLQDTVPPFDFKLAKQAVELELGDRLENLFQHFSEQPLGSASVAQVHRAVLKDGREVVLKIRRPDIERVIEVDLEILADLARLSEKLVEGIAVFDPVRVVREFSRVIRQELDFNSEAGNVERFARNFAKDRRVHVPRIFPELSSAGVLTMEYVRGVKVSDVESYSAHGLSRRKVAVAGVQLILEQVFVHGFFHADPHPGNIRVLPHNVICFLDYGMMGVLSARNRENLSCLIEGLVSQDERRVTAAVFRLSGYNHFERTQDIEADVANFIQDQLCRPLKEVQIGAILNNLTRLLVRYDIRMPSDFFLLTKAVTTIDGVGRELWPDFDVTRHLEPFVKTLVKERTSLKGLRREFFLAGMELHTLVREMPSELRELLTIFRHGELRLKLEHQGLERFIHSNDQISNRIVYAIVLAALVIGSSLMTLSGIPPKWYEIPIIGLAGFVVSGLMAFSLLWSIVRHGRM
jgi:ubiquinone biosynthesis protein